MKTCLMCSRRSRPVSRDGTSNFVSVRNFKVGKNTYTGDLCLTCADAIERSGIEVKRHEPKPRVHQRRSKPRSKKAKKVKAKK